jgi:hypothetical protein
MICSFDIFCFSQGAEWWGNVKRRCLADIFEPLALETKEELP